MAHRTSSVVNSSEKRKDVDKLLRLELGDTYLDIPNFHEAFFGNIPDLERASTEIFQKCIDETPPRFQGGWIGWPGDANQYDVLAWLADLCNQINQWTQPYTSRTTRRPLAQPDTPLDGSVAKHKLDVGFVDDPNAEKDTKYDSSHILVPGELKSNPQEDTASKARLDLAMYVKEVFTAQPTRRFILAFTLCGCWMRLWEFDRLGAISSFKFDIHKEGRRFVSTILGFLWMDNESLGFDPTIIMSGHGQQYINIERGGTTERLVIDSVIRRSSGIIGRATICWKAYSKGDKLIPLVIKDSWQFPERKDEGQLLKEATEQDVKNLARYYAHATVCIRDNNDDVQGNVRKGLDVTKASNYASVALLPPNKRPRSGSTSYSGSASPTKPGSQPLPNRIHRRIILRDYGKHIYKASCRVALLKAIEGCIKGHKSLYTAGILHRDISTNNLMINEDDDNPSWPSFLIDLDLAIKVDRQELSGAKEITGTRAFMAIGVLSGNNHSFMDDLESFFWVLFWICIHYNKEGKGRSDSEYDQWNWADTEQLLTMKRGTISKKGFYRAISRNFDKYYEPLIPWMIKLRDVVFPNGDSWEKEDVTLYSQMRDILSKAQHDPDVAEATAAAAADE